MGTKRNPGKFDCYAAAEPDEPIFTLRSKDPLAPVLVRMWVAMRLRTALKLGEPANTNKLLEAEGCAREMWIWRHNNQHRLIREKRERVRKELDARAPADIERIRNSLFDAKPLHSVRTAHPEPTTSEIVAAVIRSASAMTDVQRNALLRSSIEVFKRLIIKKKSPRASATSSRARSGAVASSGKKNTRDKSKSRTNGSAVIRHVNPNR